MMKNFKKIAFVAALLSISASAVASEAEISSGGVCAVPGSETVADNASRSEGRREKAAEHLKNHYKLYGFIRNYLAYDSRESVSGTGDLFYYLPKDRDLNAAGEDLNARNQFRFLSLTSRVGLDVSGYQMGKTRIGAKMEADFYAGLTGSTGTAQFRLRQAYMHFAWDNLPLGGRTDATASVSLRMGQAWHPLAADICPVISLASGAPFGPFSRTPQITMDAWIGRHFAVTASALWQMQYTSTGPAGASANYIKYACTPEAYVGVTVRGGGFLARAGVDILSIKPRTTGTGYADVATEVLGVKVLTPTKMTVKVSDRITTFSPFIYMEYVRGGFALKGKTVLAASGEHLNLQGGYGVTAKHTDYPEDGHYEYAPIYSSSTWLTVSYGRKWQPALMLGYYQNLGSFKDLYSTDGKLVSSDDFYFCKNSFRNLNRMYRIVPYFCCNLGKFTVGVEYELTSAQFGTPYDILGNLSASGTYYDLTGRATEGLHWVTNHRVQMMFKFSF